MKYPGGIYTVEERDFGKNLTLVLVWPVTSCVTVGKSVSPFRAHAHTGDWFGNFPRSLLAMPVWSLAVVHLG